MAREQLGLPAPAALSGFFTRACVLLPGHWVEPSTTGGGNGNALEELTNGGEKAPHDDGRSLDQVGRRERMMFAHESMVLPIAAGA